MCLPVMLSAETAEQTGLIPALPNLREGGEDVLIRGEGDQEGSVQCTRAPSAGFGAPPHAGSGPGGLGAIGGGQAEHRAPSRSVSSARKLPLSGALQAVRTAG